MIGACKNNKFFMYYYRMYPTGESASKEMRVVLISHQRKKEEVLCASLQENGQLKDHRGREAQIVKVLPEDYTYSGFFDEQYPLVAKESDPQRLYDLPSSMEPAGTSTDYTKHRTIAIDLWKETDIK